MSMIKEALEFMLGYGAKASNPIPHTRKVGPLRRIVTVNGVETVENIETPRIQYTAQSLGSVVDLISRFGDQLPTAYLSASGIDVMLNDEDRLESVSMKFEYSSQYTALLSLRTGVSQRELVRILRTKLAGCCSHEGLLAIIRQLEFDVNRGSRADVQHTKESLGRSVEKQVRANAGEMPEELSFSLPLFRVPHDVPSFIMLRCAVTIDIDNEKISLEPTGDSLVEEEKRTLDAIAAKLNGMLPEDAMLVFGSYELQGIVA